MQRNYYDPAGWPRERGEGGRSWTRGGQPSPYGAVPGQIPPPEGGTRAEAAPPPKGTGRRGRVAQGGVRGLAIFLAVLLLLAGSGISLRLRSGALFPTDEEEEWDWVEELEETTIERAPTGDGTVLEVEAAVGELLTAQEIYRQVSPAVVGVRCTMKAGTSLGTGVIMSADGYIITNAHVIAGGRGVDILFSDGHRRSARLVGYDKDSDLAVLKTEETGLPVAVFVDSATLQVGDGAYAIGNPLGEELRGTLTEGIISAIDRTVDMDGQDMTLIQTTAALNPGNSGGALINAAGQVVGITNMKMMSSWETIEGLGFAIPTAEAKPVVDDIIAFGYYRGSPALGITVQNQGPTGTEPVGALVTQVEKHSGASAAGVRRGDIIIAANGMTVTNIDDLAQAKEGLAVGDHMELTLWREGEILTVSVELMSSSLFG